MIVYPTFLTINMVEYKFYSFTSFKISTQLYRIEQTLILIIIVVDRSS